MLFSVYGSNFLKHFIYKNIRFELLGIIKKLKETAEKSVEKGVEIGVKGYDRTKEAAKKGYEKAKEEERRSSKISSTSGSPKDSLKANKVEDKSSDAIAILKLRLAKGEITEKEFLRSKKLLEE